MDLAGRIDSLLDLKLIRKSCLILFSGLILLIPPDALWVGLQSGKKTDKIFPPGKIAGREKVLEPPGFYESIFERDTLFGRVSKEGAGISKASISELAKDLRLKGVILGDEPEAIIEDARTQKTTFLKEKAQVGDLTVKKIMESRVILSDGDEETTLEIQ